MKSGQLGYVTNATANSLAFYAWAYLLYKGYSLEMIIALREKYAFDNLATNFRQAEIKESFINQSVFFLNLYRHLNENDRFEKFVKNLELTDKFYDKFQNYKDADHLIAHFNRRIYHVVLECKSMRNDYEEDGTVYKNTGVFKEELIAEKPAYYIVNCEYLDELGLQVCSNCVEPEGLLYLDTFEAAKEKAMAKQLALIKRKYGLK